MNNSVLEELLKLHDEFSQQGQQQYHQVEIHLKVLMEIAGAIPITEGEETKVTEEIITEEVSTITTEVVIKEIPTEEDIRTTIEEDTKDQTD